MLRTAIFRLVLACLLFGGEVITQPAEPELQASDLPRIPPTEPEKALDTFQLKPGFRIELVAAEPLVTDPIAICFDENSRMFVVEMRDYSERRDEKLGRIRMLEDTDGDGRMDKSTVFAEGLPWPTALFWYDGGLFVASSPDIFYLRDADGDGKAEERKIVFTGFGAQVSRLNVQALPNNFHWTLDNRIHGATSFNGGLVECPIHPEREKLTLRGQDFSFDPKTLLMRAESGGGQHGLTFDNYGRKFICSNSSHIRQVTYEGRYLDAGTAHPVPPAALDIPADGAAAEVYRISPDEPWRVIRTRWRVAGLVSGPIEGGGRASGYFTSASGLVIYRGDALGEEFVGDEFVADVGSNLIHRKKLRPNGVAFIAERPEDEQKVEFLASSDNWFRPVQLANGPDGGLYIVDMYRETIEHPWSLPPNIKRFLDLNSGNDRGRIYRIVREGHERRPWPKIGGLGTPELVPLLEHPNAWHRETAARLIHERGNSGIAPKLRSLAAESQTGLGRLHALGALVGLNTLEPADLLRALSDADAGVRENAVRWSEGLLASPKTNELWEALKQRVDDKSVRVRHQLAWTLGLLEHPERWGVLARLLQGADDSWLKHAVLAGASKAPLRVWGKLEADERYGDAGRELLALAGRRGDPEEMQEITMRLRGAEDPELVQVLGPVARGMKLSGKKVRLADLPRGAEAVRAAERLLRDSDAEVALRKDSVELIELGGAKARELLVTQLAPQVPAEVQRAAMEALIETLGSDALEPLVQRWEGLSPLIRIETIQMLLRRGETTEALLRAVAAGQIDRAEVPIHQRAQLRTHQEAKLRTLAEQVFGAKPDQSVEQLMAEYRPALSGRGDQAKGKAIYAERCASCHAFQGEGFPAGPDFETVQQAGRESALVNIIDPNREVAPRYLSYEIETADGESQSGLIAQETPASIMLRQANGLEMEIPRANITRMRSSGKSLMPEGLAEGLSAEEMSDLLSYILP